MTDQNEKAQSSTETGKSGSKPAKPPEAPIIVKGGSTTVEADASMDNVHAIPGDPQHGKHVLSKDSLSILFMQVFEGTPKKLIATFPFTNDDFLVKFWDQTPTPLD
jgi:hypothetical protein